MTKPRLTQCKRGHDLTLDNSRYYVGGTSRCKQCVQDRVRDRKRVASGIPLDSPVRPYIIKPKQTLELIKLVSENPELAKSLLSIADSWGVRQLDLA
jgi:type II secretory pathway component PulF